ncbi:MAG: universal stress protein [Anaerolineaceae bacterium]|nr:universal stress protein [Anaerolineaceae bacterium]MDD4043077.1 universal stress protein [Anaerolineaceae bacterium]MDD4576951.1 universal stress protein [Anaerolineaceae bacterium]
MAKRKLKRQLNLLQVIMLGTAGTIAAEIFVLTGHVATIAGPETVLALILAGLMTLSIALNYCELATTFPVTGGAMTYVGEAFGKGWLMFLVGSLDCLSSTFYAALSAVGFAISLEIFIPGIPIIPIAILVILFVGLMHIRGVSNVGNFQILLGAFLMAVFAAFVFKGFTSLNGFQMDIFLSGRSVFENQSVWAHIGRMLSAIALTYNAYVGFEVIADDAEEVRNPNKNIPIGILVSLLLTTLIYTSVSMVAIGTVPFSQLAGSDTALTDAATRFWPSIGVPLMGAAGIVATLTSVNSAMLSATREAFSLSRDRVWPRTFSRLSHWRTPWMAILMVVVVSALVAAVGIVDFLSFISSAGYMFVLFWATLAMPRLRKKFPDIVRPFKVPLYPLTVVAAALAGVLIISFANPQALMFLGAVMVLLSIWYFIANRTKARRELNARLEYQEGGGKVMIAAKNPETARSLTKVATKLVNQQEDTGILIFSVVKTPINLDSSDVPALVKEKNQLQQQLLEQVTPIAVKENVPIYAKLRAASRVEEGIFSELSRHKDINLVMLGVPEERAKLEHPHNILKEVNMMANRNVAVLRDKGLPDEIKRILVPVGSGPNARLALQMARDITLPGEAEIVALRLVLGNADEERMEDEELQLHEIVEQELGEFAEKIIFKIKRAESVADEILKECQEGDYDLLIIGSAEEVLVPDQVFGKLNDYLLDVVPCSMLIVRRYQTGTSLWMRKQLKKIEQ